MTPTSETPKSGCPARNGPGTQHAMKIMALTRNMSKRCKTRAQTLAVSYSARRGIVTWRTDHLQTGAAQPGVPGGHGQPVHAHVHVSGIPGAKPPPNLEEHVAVHTARKLKSATMETTAGPLHALGVRRLVSARSTRGIGALGPSCTGKVVPTGHHFNFAGKLALNGMRR